MRTCIVSLNLALWMAIQIRKWSVCSKQPADIILLPKDKNVILLELELFKPLANQKKKSSSMAYLNKIVIWPWTWHFAILFPGAAVFCTNQDVDDNFLKEVIILDSIKKYKNSNSQYRIRILKGLFSSSSKPTFWWTIVLPLYTTPRWRQCWCTQT